MNTLRWLPLAAALAAGCGSTPSTSAPPAGSPPPGTTAPPSDHATAGSAVATDAGSYLPPGHPEVPLADPSQNDNHVGRAPRRLNVAQVRQSLLNAVGVTWVDSRRVQSPDDPSGSHVDPAADMLNSLSTTLGQPDYNQFTAEVLSPGATFAKLVNDAAHKACRDGIVADLARPTASRVLLRYATERDTAASNPTAVRANLAYLALRFWARTLPPTDATLDPLLHLFTVASTVAAAPDAGHVDGGTSATGLAGTPADGWRAVCIALVNDPQFLTY